MGYDWPCNSGCEYDERHLGHCSTLDNEEWAAVEIIRASTNPRKGTCVFCEVAFSNGPPSTHPANCAIHYALPIFWRALPYVLKTRT